MSALHLFFNVFACDLGEAYRYRGLFSCAPARLKPGAEDALRPAAHMSNDAASSASALRGVLRGLPVRRITGPLTDRGNTFARPPVEHRESTPHRRRRHQATSSIQQPLGPWPANLPSASAVGTGECRYCISTSHMRQWPGMQSVSHMCRLSAYVPHRRQGGFCLLSHPALASRFASPPATKSLSYRHQLHAAQRSDCLSSPRSSSSGC